MEQYGLPSSQSDPRRTIDIGWYRTVLTRGRHDDQPTQILPLDAANRMDHFRVRGLRTGVARDSWLYDGCEWHSNCWHDGNG